MLSCVVLISGTGSNLRALLEASTHDDYPARVVAVGSDGEASGLEHAQHFNIPSFVVDPVVFSSREAWGEELINTITTYDPDVVICAGFMKILPANVVEAFSPGLINMHPALLPLYPGAHAVRDALADGATVTGATIHIVDAGVDTGPIISQVEVPVLPGDDEQTLHERIKKEEKELLVTTVRDIAHGRINLQEIANT